MQEGTITVSWFMLYALGHSALLFAIFSLGADCSAPVKPKKKNQAGNFLNCPLTRKKKLFCEILHQQKLMYQVL